MKKITSVFYVLLLCSIAIGGYASANGHTPEKASSCIVISDNDLSGPQIADSPVMAVCAEVNSLCLVSLPLEYLADTPNPAVAPYGSSPVTNSEKLTRNNEVAYHLRC